MRVGWLFQGQFSRKGVVSVSYARKVSSSLSDFECAAAGMTKVVLDAEVKRRGAPVMVHERAYVDPAFPVPTDFFPSPALSRTWEESRAFRSLP